MRERKRTVGRVDKLEVFFAPKPNPVAIIDEGEPIPDGAEVVIIDDIPKGGG